MITALVHYDEITLKGGNRRFFESKLVQNIKKAFSMEDIESKVKLEDSRIICRIESDDEDMILRILRNIFGISNFSFVDILEKDIDTIVENAEKMMKRAKTDRIALKVKRADKKFPLKSQEIKAILGEAANNIGIKIDYSFDICVNTEITRKNAYQYMEKIDGLGGLPVGTAGKVLCLLSGGIDSPVAAWLAMKRGCRVDFIHFHAFRENEEVMNSKMKRIVQILNRYQYNSKIYLIPYHHYELSSHKVNYRLDLVVFRNFMLKTAQNLAGNTYKALVTGDNLAQVASQTLSNIQSAQHDIRLPILRPIICYDKQEIIQLAQRIGTYEPSIEDYKDCCSIISKKPHTSVSTDKLKEAAVDLEMADLIEKTLEEVTVEKFSI